MVQTLQKKILNNYYKLFHHLKNKQKHSPGPEALLLSHQLHIGKAQSCYLRKTLRGALRRLKLRNLSSSVLGKFN